MSIQNFFTVEFPGYVCSKYNDFYVLDMEPKVPEYPDGNVAFDAANNPISVNNALLQVCEPRTIDGRTYDCPLGPSSLAGTGFDTVNDDYSACPARRHRLAHHLRAGPAGQGHPAALRDLGLLRRQPRLHRARRPLRVVGQRSTRNEPVRPELRSPPAITV